MIVLIGGGSRSGKSRYALEYGKKHGEPLAFIATGQALDDEMKQRVEAHRRDRGPEWHTVEEPLELGRALKECSARSIVVDCLTLWLSNLIFADRDVRRESASMLRIAQESTSTVLLVTNEVGCGIVPENELARRFRDEAGWINQQAAQAAEQVYWMVFGCPLRVK